MRLWAGHGAATLVGLVALGCVENGPLFVTLAGDGSVVAKPDAAVEPESDQGPPRVECTTNEECQAFDPPGNHTLICSSDGVCIVESCRDGWVELDGDVTRPCECPQVLPEEPVDECNSMDDDCDGMVDEGVDFSSDPQNCGACGMRCDTGLELGTLNIEALVCREARCGIGVCGAGWFNPNGRLETGCLCVDSIGSGRVPLALPDDEIFGPIFQDDEGRRRPPPEPRLTYDRDGTGVLVWARTGNGPPSDWVIRMMRVDAHGFPLGPAHTIGRYTIDGPADIEGVHAVGGRVFIVHVDYAGEDGRNHVQRIRASYAAAADDAAPTVDRHAYVFPVDDPSRSSYVAAPGGDELCVAYLTAPDPDSRDRAIVMVGPEAMEIGPENTLAVVEAGQDEAGAPVARDVDLMGMACHPARCDCLVTWLRAPGDDAARSLKANGESVDNDASHMERVAMAWGDLGALAIWSRDTADDREALAAQLDPETGRVVGTPEVVVPSPRNNSPHTGFVFADDDRDGSADAGEAFVSSWANDPNDQFELGNELVRLDANGGVADGGRIRVPWIAIGRAADGIYFAETPPRTFDTERLLTRNLPWATPIDDLDTAVNAVHGGMLGQRRVAGGWVVWSGADGVYAAQLADDLDARQVPVVVSRGDHLARRAAVADGAEGLRVIAVEAPRIRVTTLDGAGARSSVVHPLTWPDSAGRIEGVDAMAWPDGRLLVVVDGAVDGQATQTLAFVGDGEAPIALSEPAADAGVDSHLDGPGGETGALLASWRDGERQDVLVARPLDQSAVPGTARQLARVERRGPVEVVHNPESGRTFVVWLASQTAGCGASVLMIAPYDEMLQPLGEPHALFEPADVDNGRCLDWLRAVPNAGGGVTVIAARAGQKDGMVVNTDATGRSMGAPQVLDAPAPTHPRAMDVLSTRRGAVGFYIHPAEGNVPPRLQRVGYGYDCE